MGAPSITSSDWDVLQAPPEAEPQVKPAASALPKLQPQPVPSIGL